MLALLTLALLSSVASAQEIVRGDTEPPRREAEPAAPSPDGFVTLQSLLAGLGEQAGPQKAQAPQDQTEPGQKLRERQVEIIAKSEGGFSEEDRMGPNKQPDWSFHRRFATTRIYLQQPPGGVEFEQWLEIRVPKPGGKKNEVRLREEFEFGFDHHVQVDLYLHTKYKTRRSGTATTDDPSNDNTLEWRGWSAEIRWSPWNWGEVFGNPTGYFEYILFNDAEQTIEPKLLFGDELAPGWHWGVNLVYERELAGERDRTEEFKITGGISRTLIDRYVSLGISVEAAYEVEKAREEQVAAGDPVENERSRECHVGPSLQIRPIPKAHLDIEPLWGVTGESKRLKMFIVFGWDF